MKQACRGKALDLVPVGEISSLLLFCFRSDSISPMINLHYYTTASGELICNIFSSLAQFERRLIIEGTNAGLKSARARGRLGGRPRVDKESPKIRLARKMHNDKSVPIDDICASLKIFRAMLYRYLQVQS